MDCQLYKTCEICEGCALGKHHRELFFKKKAWRVKALLELIHTDMCKPMLIPTNGCNKYFIIFIDDFTIMT